MPSTNEKAPGDFGTEGFQKLTINAPDITAIESRSKAESTSIARLALAGHAVHKGRCDDYTVCKHGYSYYAQDLDALQTFAERLGVC